MNLTKNVEILGVPGVARQLTTTDAAQNEQLTSGVKRISMRAITKDARFLIQTASTPAANNATSHFIAAGERLDFAVPDAGYICYIRDSAADANGKLEVTELG